MYDDDNDDHIDDGSQSGPFPGRLLKQGPHQIAWKALLKHIKTFIGSSLFILTHSLFPHYIKFTHEITASHFLGRAILTPLLTKKIHLRMWSLVSILFPKKLVKVNSWFDFI